MRVTVIVDASYCDKSGAGGYGAWIACSRDRKPYGGPVVGAPNSGAAETMAICNALWHGLKDKLIQAGDEILVQTDCMTAIKVYEEGKWRHEKEGEAFAWLQDVSRQFNIEVTFRHVKGHSNNQDQRSKAQGHCDSRAREAMQLERSKCYLAKEKARIRQVIDEKDSKRFKKKNRNQKEPYIRDLENSRENVKHKSKMVKSLRDEDHLTEADYQTWMRL